MERLPEVVQVPESRFLEVVFDQTVNHVMRQDSGLRITSCITSVLLHNMTRTSASDIFGLKSSLKISMEVNRM